MSFDEIMRTIIMLSMALFMVGTATGRSYWRFTLRRSSAGRFCGCYEFHDTRRLEQLSKQNKCSKIGDY